MRGPKQKQMSLNVSSLPAGIPLPGGRNSSGVGMVLHGAGLLSIGARTLSVDSTCGLLGIWAYIVKKCVYINGYVSILISYSVVIFPWEAVTEAVWGRKKRRGYGQASGPFGIQRPGRSGEPGSCGIRRPWAPPRH